MVRRRRRRRPRRTRHLHDEYEYDEYYDEYYDGRWDGSTSTRDDDDDARHPDDRPTERRRRHAVPHGREGDRIVDAQDDTLVSVRGPDRALHRPRNVGVEGTRDAYRDRGRWERPRRGTPMRVRGVGRPAIADDIDRRRRRRGHRRGRGSGRGRGWRRSGRRVG